MDPVKKIILDSLPEGVIRTLVERNLRIAAPSDYGIFPRASVDINLPGLTLKIARFVETDHWWIDDGIYDYYTVETLERELIHRITRSIAWKHIEK